MNKAMFVVKECETTLHLRGVINGNIVFTNTDISGDQEALLAIKELMIKSNVHNLLSALAYNKFDIDVCNETDIIAQWRDEQGMKRSLIRKDENTYILTCNKKKVMEFPADNDYDAVMYITVNKYHMY